MERIIFYKVSSFIQTVTKRSLQFYNNFFDGFFIVEGTLYNSVPTMKYSTSGTHNFNVTQSILPKDCRKRLGHGIYSVQLLFCWFFFFNV